MNNDGLDKLEGARYYFVGYGNFLARHEGEDQAQQVMEAARILNQRYFAGKPKIMRFTNVGDLVDQAVRALDPGEKIVELIVDDHGGPGMQLFGNDWLYVNRAGRYYAEQYARRQFRDPEWWPSNLHAHARHFHRLRDRLHGNGVVALQGCNVTARVAEQGASTGEWYGLLSALSRELGGVEVRGSFRKSSVPNLDELRMGGESGVGPGNGIAGCRFRQCRPVRPSWFHDNMP